MKNSILYTFIQTVLIIGVHAGFNFRKSPVAASNATQASCSVSQGALLTFISCSNSYEIYDTVAISQDPQLLTAYGESTTKLDSPRPTLEKNSDSRITYLLNNTLVMTAFELNGVVYKRTLMSLILTSG
jgi:hypothetical protein